MKKIILLFLIFIPLISFSQESDDAQSKINDTHVEGFFPALLVFLMMALTRWQVRPKKCNVIWEEFLARC